MSSATKYSQREKFSWLNHADLLGKSSIIWQGVEQLNTAQQETFWTGKTPKELWEKLAGLVEKKEYVQEIIHTIESNPKEIRDYCKVRQSQGKATTILLSLCQREVSINELDKGENKKGITYDYPSGFKVSVKKTELSRIAATGGSKGNWDSLIKIGATMGVTITNEDIKRALWRKRRPLHDPNQISIVGHFLVNYWCGEKYIYGMWRNWFETADKYLSEKVGVVRDNESYICKKSPSFFFIPPLCFFSNCALATFCAMALDKNPSDPATTSDAIRKWISRFGLKHASHPKIIDAKTTGDGIYFQTRL